MRHSRYVYNRCVADVRENGNEQLNKGILRDKFVTYKSRKGILNPNIEDWERELDVPKGPRDGAVRDLQKAYKTAFSNLKNNNISKFKIGFRSKKNGFQSIVIPKNSVTIINHRKVQIFPDRNLGLVKVTKRDKKKIGHPSHDCR